MAIKSDLILGTYSSDGISFSYSVPSVLPREMAKKVSFETPTEAEITIKEEEKSEFDQLLKKTVLVPRPKKTSDRSK
jgi:hypothetical protein